LIFFSMTANTRTTCLIAFGGNVDDPQQQLAAAVVNLEQRGVIVERVSRHWVTQAVGGPADQADYLNAAIVASTDKHLLDMMAILREVEEQGGRRREARWGPRRIDLDLLLFGDSIHEDANVCVPHPRMTFRRFVLDPACDVAADMIEPVTGENLNSLRNMLIERPPQMVWLTENPERVAALLAQLVEREKLDWRVVALDETPIIESVAAESSDATKQGSPYVVRIVTSRVMYERLAGDVKLGIFESLSLNELASLAKGPYLCLNASQQEWGRELLAAVDAMQSAGSPSEMQL
jgi:2-amino-4-hydroxy-6-hydroxymethyldihydropteridine diphosphokinase